MNDAPASLRARNLSDDPVVFGGMTDHHIAVVGTGHVGTVTAACFAKLGHQVVGIDSDALRASQLASGQAPFYEPGLPELLNETVHSGRLRFTSDVAEGLTDTDVVFLCVGTPTGPDGQPNLSQVESATRSLAPHLRDGTVIVNKSTVPVGSGNWVRTLFEDHLPQEGAPRFAVVSNPEFLREGSAIADFLFPDRVVLGGGDEAAVERIAALYEPVLRQQFDGADPRLSPRLVLTDLMSAEMIKYAANAFLATKVSFANEIANLCELVGADALEVLPAIGADSRIGPLFLRPGVGWGGSCFGKDVTALIATGREHGYDLQLLRATIAVNQLQRHAVVRKLQQGLKVLKGRRIAILGLAFKPGTDDLRDAPALDIARRLIDLGAAVTAYDPVVKELPPEFAKVRISPDPYEAATHADALVVATEWEEFRSLDFDRIAERMSGVLVIDGRNALDVAAATAAGLDVVPTGRSC